MRSHHVRRVLPFLVTALLAVAVPRADALVAGTGQLKDVDFDGSPPNFTFDGSFTWDDATFVVFGSSVNLGQTLPGDQTVANGQVTSLNLGDLSADFVVDLLSTSPSGGFLDLKGVTGSAVCTAPSCLNATATFIGTVDDLDQSGTGIPEDDLLYSIDGSISLDFSLKGSGPFGLNGFLLNFTPEGTSVTVSSGEDTFYDSREGAIVGFAAEATFASVSDAGSTVFQALSAAEGTIPANFVIDPPGFDSVFIDVSTTASYTPPVEVCIVIPDTVTIPLDQLHILHRPGYGPASPTGAFVDVTSSIKTAPNRICGTVDSLSPFVVALDTEGPSTTTVPSTTTTTTTASTTTTVQTTTTTVIEPTSTTTLAPTTTTTVAPTTTTTTTTVAPTTTTTTSTTSTTFPPTCIAAATFESILCRLDEAIALVEASGLEDPVAGNLLRSLTNARRKTVDAESRVGDGRTRGAKGKLKSAARSLNGVLFRLRSLSGSRRIPAELRTELAELVAPIQGDMLELRGSL